MILTSTTTIIIILLKLEIIFIFFIELFLPPCLLLCSCAMPFVIQLLELPDFDLIHMLYICNWQQLSCFALHYVSQKSPFNHSNLLGITPTRS